MSMTLKRIVICSGKGGVGKSMLSSALAMLFAEKKKVIAVDCDADAPNLAIWLGEPENWQRVRKISLSEKPVILNSKLTKEEAKECLKKCRFGALKIERGKLKLNTFLCEGCGACEFFCPRGAIKMKPVKSGEIKVKRTKYGFPLVSGQLYPGQTGSGKMVAEIKKEAESFAKNFNWPKKLQSRSYLEIIDSAPGTSCPVIASLRDASFAVLVTEPSPSGFVDLKRVLRVVHHFNIPWRLVINKWDINPQLANKMKKWSGNRFLGKISYDQKIFQSLNKLIPIVKTNLRAKTEIKEIHKKLIKIF